MIARKLVITLLSIGLALDLGISGVLYWNDQRINRVDTKANIAQQAAYEACLFSNADRRADLTRWQEVLKLVFTMPRNQATERFVAGVQAANATADQLRDCNTVKP